MRVSKYYSLDRKQPTLDFVDVDINRDTPFYIDPRAILELNNDWGDYSVTLIQDFFQTVLTYVKNEKHDLALRLLKKLREPNETHLGLSKGRSRGTALGDHSSEDVWKSLTESEAVASGLIEDLEDTILLIPGISYDIISDITTNIIRDALIVYTQEACSFHEIPMQQNIDSGPTWDMDQKKWRNEYTSLPLTRYGKLLLVPKAIARKTMAYDNGEYYRHFILEFLREKELQANSNLVHVLKNGKRKVYKKHLMARYGTGKEMIAEYTKKYPEILDQYRKYKDKNKSRLLSNEMIVDFNPEDMPDWDKLLLNVTQITPGRENASHYEKEIEKLLTALFYPSLTNPKAQHEIHGGRKRIDITYTNTSSDGFFAWLSTHYTAPYFFIECKNYVNDPKNPEIDQLSGRFSRERGRVGILLCRSISNKELMMQRCKDTANDGRGFILPLDDSDLIQLVNEVKSTFLQPKYPLLREQFDKLVM